MGEVLPHFYYHSRMMEYDFGPGHPLKPIRLDRTIKLLQAVVQGVAVIDPGAVHRSDLLRVHSDEYVSLVERVSAGDEVAPEVLAKAGFGSDTPVFGGIFEAAGSYVAGSVQAAMKVRDGAALAFNIGGGLHHARRNQASGFCVFNDPAIACAVLREKFGRVAYIDIDLHHGDGVQWIFYDDPAVLTYSIHETGRTLFPGTGFVHESGPYHNKINVPIEPGTADDAWRCAFRETLIPAMEKFQPEAIVLQMGCDPHFDDPLGHLNVSVQAWLGAVETVRDLRIPIVACGGGGYHLANVPRMWVAAILTLAGLPVPKFIPQGIPKDWAMSTFLDPARSLPVPFRHDRQPQMVDEVLLVISQMNP